jgi:SAM-dependent methyltransferase
MVEPLSPEPGRPKFDAAFTAAWYDQLAENETGRWERRPDMRVQKAVYLTHLRQRITPGDRVLDAGCGPGTFATPLLEYGARVTCLDLSEVQLGLCRSCEPNADSYLRASITDLPLADATFDVSLALGASISYCFERSSDAVRELARVTRPGGIIGLSVANLMGSIHRWLPHVLSFPPGWNRTIVDTGNQGRHVNGHEIHLFRPAELRELLTDAGLVDIELHAPGWLSSLHEAIPLPGTPEWEQLVELELNASAECPGAGTHILAWARVPG